MNNNGSKIDADVHGEYLDYKRMRANSSQDNNLIDEIGSKFDINNTGKHKENICELDLTNIVENGQFNSNFESANTIKNSLHNMTDAEKQKGSISNNYNDDKSVAANKDVFTQNSHLNNKNITLTEKMLMLKKRRRKDD